MLKNKLSRKTKPQEAEVQDNKRAFIDPTANNVKTSEFFPTAFWKQFLDIEYSVNPKLKALKPSGNITHTYNPLEYAEEIHVEYLKRFLDGPKKVLFVGMNPGPNGMGQTGVPFGNISSVRDLMKLDGQVGEPNILHPKRPVVGLDCTTEEPSGVRIWSLFNRLSGDLDTFAKQCFVHNFCPLIFYDKDGKNITPSELKGDYKTQIRDLCLATLDDIISLVDPEIIVAVGDYVFTTLKKSRHLNSKIILRLPHPSPRALNNQNWPEKAEQFLQENDLMKFIRNEYTK